MKRTTGSLLVLITLFLGVVVAYMVSVRPWQSKVLSHGYSPDGREYCIVQTFKDLVEPYQVSFYVRDADGTWRWNYLEHEDNGWKSASVKFSGGSAKVERNGAPFKDIKLPTDQVDLPNVLPGYRDRYCASALSVEEVFAFHNQKYR